MTVTGTNFVSGVTALNFAGTGTAVGNTVYASTTSTSLTAFLTLSDPGSYTVSVTTAGGTSAGLPFTVTPNLIASASHFVSSHFAGSDGGSGIADGTGGQARFIWPERAWSDGTNLYVADYLANVIRKVVIASGVTTTVAGLPGVSGAADGVGTVARFNSPSGVWGDGTNLYVADTTNYAIRKIVLATGAVSTLAGTFGASGLTNATGAAARFNLPGALCGDGTNLFVADSGNNEIRKVVISTGAVTLIAGSTTGLAGSSDLLGTAAGFSSPQGVFCDGANVYVADSANHTIRKIALSNNQVSTLAGKATVKGPDDGTGGVNGTARFNVPVAIWGDGTNLYVADHDNSTIRKVAIIDGTTTTVSGVAGSVSFADGTGAPGGTARFANPNGIWGVGGNLYVSDQKNNAIRIVSKSTGAATTLAGLPGGFSGTTDATGTSARFSGPTGLTDDGSSLYVTDQFNTPRIRKIALANIAVSTLVGQAGKGSVDGDASIAEFNSPSGVWTDGSFLYISDHNNSAIRKTNNTTGFTSTLSAPGTTFSLPSDMWGDGINLYITDTAHHVIRKMVIATGTVTTLAGAGAALWADGIGTNAFFAYPSGIWGDGTYLYVADGSNFVIRKINIGTQEVTTLAGEPNVIGFNDGYGSNAHFSYLGHIWGDRSNLYVLDGNYALRKVALDSGLVTTLAGGHSGSEDGIDSNVGFSSVTGIWGNGTELYVSDATDNSIRKLVPTTLGAPAVSSITAASGSRNSTVGVTLLGTNFIPGASTVSISGTNVTVSSATVTGPGTLLVNFNITSSATTGARNVTVTTSAGTSAPVTFTIN
jgi:sugar lactone lactonase YvrE